MCRQIDRLQLTRMNPGKNAMHADRELVGDGRRREPRA